MQNFPEYPKYPKRRNFLLILPLLGILCAAYFCWNEFKTNEVIIEASIQGNPAAIEILAKYDKPWKLDRRLVSEAIGGNENAMKALRLDIPAK